MPITDCILYSFSQLHSKRAGSRLMGSKEVPSCIITGSVVLISAFLLCEAAPLPHAPACEHFCSQPRVVTTGGAQGRKAFHKQPKCAWLSGQHQGGSDELLADGLHRPVGTSSICVSEDLCALCSQGQGCGWWVRGVCAHRLFKKCIERTANTRSQVRPQVTDAVQTHSALLLPWEADGHRQYNPGSLAFWFRVGFSQWETLI